MATKKTATYPKYYLNQRYHWVIKVEKASDLDKWKDYPMAECDESGKLK